MDKSLLHSSVSVSLHSLFTMSSPQLEEVCEGPALLFRGLAKFNTFIKRPLSYSLLDSNIHSHPSGDNSNPLHEEGWKATYMHANPKFSFYKGCRLILAYFLSRAGTAHCLPEFWLESFVLGLQHRNCPSLYDWN